ncbi:MAG: 2-oxoacid:acceptor oxidoreductase family protein [Anaerolineae bacterium]|jgi:2-oxoglutarate ferredoxin oxidoreductase subunit gamma|nr:2-oxoacid:acceptor oxidoreductase family protein [Anaerolineae bacterium]
MQNEIIVSGFGGQGVLFGGQLIAYTAMDLNKQVTWIPSYGPEMRGGTANCTVIVSDDEIGSPLVNNPKAVIAMNLPSLNKYENLVKPGGVLIVNTSMVDRTATRADITIMALPGNEIAEELGTPKSLNMVMLGALLSKLPIFTLDDVAKSMEIHTPERNKRFIAGNITALKAGFDFKG